MARRQIPARLPAWEQGVYWIAEVFTIFYMLYSLYRASEQAWRNNEPIKVEDGWAALGGRPRDTADFEWEFWCSFFWNLLPLFCIHIAFSQVLAFFDSSAQTRCYCLTLFGVLGATYLLGFYVVLVMCVHPSALFLVSKLGSSKAVWATTLVFLTGLNFGDAVIARWFYQLGMGGEHVEASFYMCVFVWANVCQRATGFALESVWAQNSLNVSVTTTSCTHMDKTEKIGDDDSVDHESEAAVTDKSSPKKRIPVTTSCTTDKTEKTGDDSANNESEAAIISNESSSSKKRALDWPTLAEVPDWLDMLYYVFYLPLFFTGPLIIYNDFHRQARHPLPITRARLGDVMFRLVRVAFWAAFNVVTLHFIYAHAINTESLVLAKQSRWTVAAIGYVLGQFFMTKYLVLFGLPAQLSRLDGFEPPAVPACISYIYCYSDMWKSFDRGLYHFMKRYIFIPLGGSRAGTVRQVGGGVMCFAYVFYWHGAEFYIFLWCVLNFVETGSEQVGAWLEKTYLVRRVLYDRLSPAGVRRVRAVMSVPVFLMSVFAIFYFFGGTDSGLIFLRKLLIDIPWASFAIFLLLVYCAVQNAMEVERLGLTKLKVYKTD